MKHNTNINNLYNADNIMILPQNAAYKTFEYAVLDLFSVVANCLFTKYVPLIPNFAIQHL